MSQDVAIIWDSEAIAADWGLAGEGQLLLAPALQTAVMVSLFTDRRATDDDVLPPGETDRRGWWGEQLDGQPIGSRLWLLRRAKRMPETLRLARDYIREALAWLIDDALASRIDVETEWGAAGRLVARITIHRASGAVSLTAEWAWQGI